LLLEPLRGDVAERRVSASRVVEALDELEDLEPRLTAAPEGAPIDQLALERCEERLGDRVVEGVAAAADRLDDAGLLERLAEGSLARPCLRPSSISCCMTQRRSDSGATPRSPATSLNGFPLTR